MLLNEAGLAVEMGKASLVVQPMSLLAGIAIRYPDVGLVTGHGVANDLGGAAEHGGMDDGIGRAEHPLIAVAAFDPHSGFVAGYNIGTAQDREGIVAPGGKDRRCALEHVHQRTLADIKPEQIAKYTLQPLVGKQLVGLQVERQRVNATAKRRALRRLWHGRAGCLAACRAATGQPAVPPNNRLDLGQVDLVIFPDHLARRILAKWQAAMLAMRRAMVFVCIGQFGQRAGVPRMPRLGAARPRTVSLRLPVRRWRLRRRSRRLARALQTQQQFDQLRLRKPLEFLAIHEQCESRQRTLGKEGE